MSALDHMTDDDLRVLVAAARMQYSNRRGRAPRLLRAILKYTEANAINRLALWLRVNGISTQEELEELLELTNDNPNIVPLPPGPKAARS